MMILYILQQGSEVARVDLLSQDSLQTIATNSLSSLLCLSNDTAFLTSGGLGEGI